MLYFQILILFMLVFLCRVVGRVNKLSDNIEYKPRGVIIHEVKYISSSLIVLTLVSVIVNIVLILITWEYPLL